tara:strand:+ start:1661 stop:2101 length:441 start_codon:yes stop_codon:yes gene_type:complete
MKKLNYTLLIIGLLCIDQISKNFIKEHYYKLINKDFILITFEYVRNSGAAFNLFEGNRLFLSLVSIISSMIIYYFIFIKETKILDKYGLSFILAGSLGNGIDRILDGNVIDFIKLKFIEFPVFNIADISINIGVLILIFGYFKYNK